MDAYIGKTIGRYQVDELLGQGGAAMVYRAKDTALERSVALKLILPQQQHSERFLKRFQREAKSLAQLSHPAVVKILDYGEMEGKPYLVTEYVSGGTLASRMGKPWNVAEAAAMLAPVAQALAYAHQRHIIHRDVKPSNILLNETGQPMLSDFGIAKLTDTEESQSLTGTGVMVGTPAYMAPEQIQGHAVDARTDVYALAVVFFEMVTGRRPYLGATPIEVTVKHLNDPIPRARQLVRDLPSEVEQALLKGMAKKPEDRYQDMAAFAAILERYAAGKKGRAPAGAAQSSQTGSNPGASAQASTAAEAENSEPSSEGLTVDGEAPTVRVSPKPAARRRRLATGAALAVIVFAALAGVWMWQGQKAADAATATAAAVAVEQKTEVAMLTAAAVTPTPRPTLAPTRTKAPTRTVEVVTIEQVSAVTPAPEAEIIPTPTFHPMRIQPGNLNQVIEINRLERVSVIALDWTRDSKWIVVAGSKFITMINPTTMKADQVISLGNDVPKTLALAPDSQSVYVMIGNKINVYSLSTRQQINSFSISNGGNSLAISPDGTLLAVGTLDNKTILINSADGVVRRTLRSNYGGWAVAFSPDGSRVASCTSQGVLMWEVETGRLIPLPGETNTMFKSVTFSTDGAKLAAGADGKIVVWDLTTNESQTLSVPLEQGVTSTSVNSLSFTPDNALLISGADDQRVRVWEGTKMAHTMTSHVSPVYSIAISPDGRFIASGANEGVVRLWGLP